QYQSTNHALYNVAKHKREPSILPLIFNRETLVIDTQRIEHGGMEIVHRNRVLDGSVAEVVGGAEGGSTLDAPAGEHKGEAFDVVIAAVAPLGHGCSPKLTSKHHEGILEHVALFQVLDQCGGGPVRFLRFNGDVGLDSPVVVPIPVVELDEPHTAFRQAPREQAVRCKRTVAGL